MIRRVLVCGLILLFVLMQARAQSDSISAYKNNVKLNTLGVVFNNVSLLYERTLDEHWTLLAGTGFRWGGGLPKALALGNVIFNSETGGIRGYSFTPELRYYFNTCECGGAPSGLYAGLYGRYTRLYGDLSVHVWTGQEYADVATAGNFRELGLGLQLGYQFQLGERFTVDLMVAGPRLATNRIRFSLESDYAEEVIPIIEEEINEKLEWLGMDPIHIDPSTEVDTRFGFKYFRYGIAFGFRF